jgi:Flp pilus assembly protein TadD
MIKLQKIGARLGFALLGAGMLLSAPPALAQTGNPGMDSPGDALSRNLRSLAENPKSVHALIGAGKAALELGDPQAAITFFGRAEEQAPRDGRVKMWLGASLVQLQQPQGALKFFAEAVSMGAPEAEVAGARGLAYDLLGDPRRAQRDYRLALGAKPNAEVSRRLALSLAISGEREAALQALEDQLLIRDRAAERTRVFVLALTGDATGAARAVQTSMPAQSAAMTPFLQRLPALSASERALAVHLGHFPSHARNLPVPAPNTYAAYTPSTTTTRAGAPDARQPALGSRSGGSAQPSQRRATVTPPPATAPAAQPQRVASAAPGGQKPKAEPVRRTQPSSGPPADSAWAWSRGSVTTRRTESAAPKAAAPMPAAPPAQQQAAAISPSTPAGQQVASLAPARTDELQQIAGASPAPAPVSQVQQVAAASPVPSSGSPQQQPAVPVTVAPGPVQQQLAAAVPAPPATAPVQTAAVAPSLAQAVPGFSIAAAQPPGQQQPTSEMTSVEAAPPPASGVGEQNGASRLAGIASLIAALPQAAPAEEMKAVPEPARPAPAPAAKPAPKPVAPAVAVAKKELPVKVAAKKEPPAAASKAPAASAAAKKEAPAAAKMPAAPAEPSRIWVQVAGGADKAALPREFTRLKTKAPKLLAARTAWTTPLKATNRLLVGPFKTDKEAQEFVNELGKLSMSGFAWTSDPGQKIEKLSAK